MIRRILPSIIIILGIVVPPVVFWKIGGSVAVLAGYGASLLLLALLVGTASRGGKQKPVNGVRCGESDSNHESGPKS